MLKAVRGTKDIFQEELGLRQRIEAKACEVFTTYNYQEISTPIIEELDLFQRTLGAHSDIVSKQMFVIKKDKDNLCLRPEATAAVVRAYLENNLDKEGQLYKFYYMGPMFRAERPQKGRLRQFSHIGVEAIGVSGYYQDAEVICLADSLLKNIGIKDFEIKLNSLGCAKDKEKLAELLKKSLKDKLSSLCTDCQNRYKKNVFRILDCKNEICQETVSRLNLANQHLCSDCLDNLNNLKSLLKSLKINYKLVSHLVRGLDYYTGTVFEITHPALGSQDALGAGGRYDHLIKELGGKDTPAIGFALGVERLLLALPGPQVRSKSQQRINGVYIAALGARAIQEGFLLLDILRKRNIISEMDCRDLSLKANLRRADKLNFRFVIMLGDNELQKNVFILKDMLEGTQQDLPQENIVLELEKRLKS